MNQFQEKLDQAQQQIPLRTVMQQRGKDPTTKKCPFCGHGSAGVFNGDRGIQLFKCHHTDCPTGNKAFDQVGFLSYELQISRTDAAIVLMKEAGVWQDQSATSPRVMPGQQWRKNKLPRPEQKAEILPKEDLSVPDALADEAAAVTAGSLAEAAESSADSGSKSNPPGNELTVPRDADVATVAGPVTPLTIASTTPLSSAPAEVPTPDSHLAEADELGAVNLPEPAQQALRWFYERLTLTAEDQQKLWLNRGLNVQTCEALGFRSNPQSNQEILLEMEKHFPLAVLLDCGLWTTAPTDPTAKPKPNAQFYGMSLVEKRDAKGKKVRDKHDKVVIDFVWNQPVLIPYFDERGELIHLRPHKGMMRDKASRLYVARLGKEWLAQYPGVTSAQKPNYGLITEGEFKAAALFQVFGWRVAVAAMPGITMARTVQGDVEEWLSLPRVAVAQVVVGYDNEDKGNPNLPGFIEESEEWKRYEVTVWARLLARLLGREGWDARVMALPNAWRNAKGKADWDGRLAEILKQARASSGLEGEALWSKVGPVALREFETEIKKARPVHELYLAGFFDGKAERMIRNRLGKLAHRPALPIGGDGEVTIARRLHRVRQKLKESDWFPDKKRGFLHLLAKQYADLKGGYYVIKPLRDKGLEEWTALKVKAKDKDAKDIERACDLAIEGVPQRISDFYMKAHYVLRRQNGTRQRLVTLHNIHGVDSPLLALPSEPFSTPTKFRHWLLDNLAGATWKAGERELNDLQADVAREVSHKDVLEVPQRGFHKESKCWFYGDVTFDPDGKELFPDKHGIIWVRTRVKSNPGGDDDDEKEIAQAYKLADKDHEGQTLRLGEPLLTPPGMNPKAVNVPDAEVGKLFEEFVLNMYETIGSHAAQMLVGAILSCGAGPEIYATYSGFPGLWVHGEPRQGKSSVSRWGMAIFGQHVDKGMPLEDSTKAGLGIALQQYGNLLVWLEEYQPTAPKWMIEKIKNIYGRESGTKKTFDEGDREILASAIVTGVATSMDAQLRSRYVHVQVASKNRRGEHYGWFEANRKKFCLIGRYIMRNRKRFTALTLSRMETWLNLPELKGADARARIVHGSAFAALGALAEMLQVTSLLQDQESFQYFLVNEVTSSVKEVDEQVNVNQFWRLLLDALLGDAFGKTPKERRRVFKAEKKPTPVELISPKQLAYEAEQPFCKYQSYYVYFLPGPVIEMLRTHLRKQGREYPLEQPDLRSQMKMRKYWHPPKKDMHRKKFEGMKSSVGCWGIEVDYHPEGYFSVSDDEFFQSFKKDGDMNGLNLSSAEWIDPRRGGLFMLIESLVSSGENSDEN